MNPIIDKIRRSHGLTANGLIANDLAPNGLAPNPTRRSILKAAVAAGAALTVPIGVSFAEDPKKKEENPFAEWVRIDSTGAVTIFSARSEMGQESLALSPWS